MKKGKEDSNRSSETKTLDEVIAKGKFIGDEYLKTDSRTWYFPDDVNNLKYLICKDADDSLTLWMFISFATEEVKTYTYGDVLSIIYGVHGADDIVSITTSPFQANNTDEGKAIQKKIGTHTYTDREAINMFYNIVKDVICYGADGEDPAKEWCVCGALCTVNDILVQKIKLRKLLTKLKYL